MVAGVITQKVHETKVLTLLIYCQKSKNTVYIHVLINTVEYLGVAKTM